MTSIATARAARAARRRRAAVSGLFELRHVRQLRAARRGVQTARRPRRMNSVQRSSRRRRRGEPWRRAPTPSATVGLADARTAFDTMAHGPEARLMVLVTAETLRVRPRRVVQLERVRRCRRSTTRAVLLHSPGRRASPRDLVLAFAAKLDAEKLRELGVAGHVVHHPARWQRSFCSGRDRPTIHGSKRFLFGASFQPSEFAKLAVVVWVSMLIVKKGETCAASPRD